MSKNTGLSEKSVEKNPFIQFENWYRENLSSNAIYPDSFSLGTSSADGRVSVRTVLLKEYNQEGFVFFTNYESKKGNQLASNPRAAMLFYWSGSGRQVRIEGHAEKLSVEESYRYFSSRPRESRIGAWSSNQSRPIPDRDLLDKTFLQFAEKFEGVKIPLPPDWGGYRIKPDWFEFWQEGKHRLHDRISYEKSGSGWLIRRLSP